MLSAADALKLLQESSSRHQANRVRVPHASTAIVMSDPLRQEATQIAFLERNDPIEAFTPCGADHSFAIGVRLAGALALATPAILVIPIARAVPRHPR